MYPENNVSVIIPAFNAERYIGGAIESVLGQSYHNYEIVVVNDCSRDKTAAVISAFNDARIHLINHSTNMGPGASRNTAIGAARGRWIALLDADDQWHPDRLCKLVEIALAVGDNYFVSDDRMVCFNTSEGLKPWGRQLNLYYKVHCDEQNLSLDLEGFFKIGCPGINPLIPLDHIKKHKLYYDQDCRMGEDFEFYCNLFRTGLKLHLCKEPLYYYRLTPGSLTTDRNKVGHRIGVYRRLLVQEGFTVRERQLIGMGFQKLKNRQSYEEFTSALKLKQFRKAAYLAACKPRLVIELLRSLPDSLRYRRAAWKFRGDIK